MPGDMNLAQRPASPVVVDDKIGKKDKNFRRYASAVERALSVFDTALQEWADYIAFLNRLLKALQTKPTGVDEVPYSAVVAKRLSQCLNSTLPPGVHQKALDVYSVVFAVLGKEGLSRELHRYLPGLSPVLSFAVLTVKPGLLKLFEDYILPLNPGILQPALKAIILALLPGLEEEGSDEFERTLALLNRFRDNLSRTRIIDGGSIGSSNERVFWQSLFLTTITSPSRRQGALAYLLRGLPKLDPSRPLTAEDGDIQEPNIDDMPDSSPHVRAITSPEPGLLIRCFAAGLQDDQLLTQRGFLDLLVTNMPLNSAVLQRVSSQDLELLMTAAASVVARREMSLNRRLWVWLLGQAAPQDTSDKATGSPDSGSSRAPAGSGIESPTQYFRRYGFTPLRNSLLKGFQTDSAVAAVRAKPFRICLSLMDRWEVGGLIVPQIFRPAMESLYDYKTSAPTPDSFSELLRSANVLFDGIQSHLIWREVVSYLDEALDMQHLTHGSETFQSTMRCLDLVDFVVKTFNIREEDMLTTHLPNALIVTLTGLEKLASQSTYFESSKGARVYRSSLAIAVYLLDQIPSRSFQPSVKSLPTSREVLAASSDPKAALIDVSQEIRKWYQSLDPNGSAVDTSLEDRDIGAIATPLATRLLVQNLSRSDAHMAPNTELSLLKKLMEKCPSQPGVNIELLLEALIRSSSNTTSGETSLPILLEQVTVLEFLLRTVTHEQWLSDHRVRIILRDIVKSLWACVSPSAPIHNVEAIRCLWRVHAMCPDDRLVEATVTGLMQRQEEGSFPLSPSIDGVRRFTTIWSHSISLSTQAPKRGPQQLQRMHSLADVRLERLEYSPEVLARPLLLLLDALDEQNGELPAYVRSWLQSLPSLSWIIDLLAMRLDASPFMGDLRKQSKSKTYGKEVEAEAIGQIEESIYYIHTISNILAMPSTNVSSAVAAQISAPSIVQSLSTETDEVPNKEAHGNPDEGATLRDYLLKASIFILQQLFLERKNNDSKAQRLNRASALLLQRLVSITESAAHDVSGLQSVLIKLLSESVQQKDTQLQIILIDDLTVILRQSSAPTSPLVNGDRRRTSKEDRRSISQVSLAEKPEKDHHPKTVSGPDPLLLDCVILGLSSTDSQGVLEHWVRFLEGCLPLFATNTFQVMLPLTECLGRSIESIFHTLRDMFADPGAELSLGSEPIQSISTLFNGLEQVLARGHDQILADESRSSSQKSPEQVQGFFGNMVSGVFTSEAQASRSGTANNRLTVILCFKDAVKVAFRIWSWGDDRHSVPATSALTAASFNYTSIRLKNRTRRALEHLFSAEALECLETLIEAWQVGRLQSDNVMNLLNTLEASRPKNTVPTIFNAIYSRTNPAVLATQHKSTLTSEVSEVQLATFLINYTRSMDDDALDEIWADCMSFSKDVLGNPMPHRQILPLLLEFIAVLGVKIDNTNFGEQRRMRKDIGDLFVRLLAAIFTIKPITFPHIVQPSESDNVGTLEAARSPSSHSTSPNTDVVVILALILPKMIKLLIDTDRIAFATSTISLQILMPAFHWKSFPNNVTIYTLRIVQALSRVAEISKVWKKDVAEAFNDSRFFSSKPLSLVVEGWIPILRQWALIDRDRMAELLSRLSAPASAGIMFGVGASSARLEADRKAQLNLRRIALLTLSCSDDAFVINMSGFQEKVAELLNATAASSPSSVTRGEIYMVLRALILKNSAVHLASLWPIINAELFEALSSIGQIASRETYNITSILQAAKLLDALLMIAPDDFQLSEWLFITDTTDAVYRSQDWKPVSLADRLAELLDSESSSLNSASVPFHAESQTGVRRPMLRWEDTHDLPREKLLDRVLRPFLRQLSINSFESTYQMESVDSQACHDELLKDLFDDSTLV